MALDNINHIEDFESLQSIIQKTSDNLSSLRENIESWDEKETPEVNSEENGDERTKTRERIEINPEILKEEMRKDLKTVSLMSLEEIETELTSYGVEIPEICKSNIIKLRGLLTDARNTIANEDKNSNIVDFHIGTYIQGKNKYCSVLSQLDTMTDDKIRDMIQIKEDSNNKISYHIRFPNGDTTVITEEELNSWTINEDWQNKVLNDLPKWDKDVRLIIMAYVKIFWTNIIDNWEWQYKAQNRFRAPTEPKLKDNQHFEDIQDYSNLPQYSTIWTLDNDEIKRKGINIDFRTHTANEVSWIEDRVVKTEATRIWAAIMTFANGKKVCISQGYIYISDWTLIPRWHGMSFRWYDKESEELIVSWSEFNNISEVRIPKELFIFLETASLEWTPGVDKTPQPTE